MKAAVAGAALIALAACGDGGAPAAAPTLDVTAGQTPAASPATGPRALAARELAVRYFGLLSEGRYRQAYRLWAGDGRVTGISAREFEQGFAGTTRFDATLGDPSWSSIDTGQRGVRVPVRVQGARQDGGAFIAEGTVSLSRVDNIVATDAEDEQRHWRIVAVSLTERPPGEDDADPIVVARHACEGGRDFIARFDNARGTVAILRDGREVATLDQQRAASGIWYARDGFELRGKGREAMLTEPGRRPVNCTSD